MQVDSARIKYRNFPDLARMRWPHLTRLEILGPPHQHIFKAIKKSRSFYERDLLDEIALRIPDTPGTVIDVGANLGNHSLFFSKVLCKYLVSVEPQDAVANLLERNLAFNGAEGRNEVLRVGIGEKPGTAVIVNERAASDTGSARLDLDPSTSGGEGTAITTIDTICRDRPALPVLQLIKIDTEGMEISVLRGAAATIKKYKPLISVEAASPADLDRINEFLAPLGYFYVGPFAWTPTYIFYVTPNPGLRTAAWQIIKPLRKIALGLTRLVSMAIERFRL